MRAFVFTDKALERYAGRFVWLAVDTENAANQAFLEKHPVEVWPTLMVIDPRRETIVVRYTGGATVPQLTRLLADAERLSRRRDLGSSDSLLVSADALVGQRRHAEAAKLYEQALARAPQRWAP